MMVTLGKIVLATAFALFGSACQSLVTPAGNLRQTPAPPPQSAAAGADDTTEKVETVRQQDFQFIYVFRRKDGASLNAEDKKFLRANSPPETNQWVVTGDGRAAIAGTNYQFPPASLEILQTRFALEDNSPPRTDGGAPANPKAGN